jgi:predicted phosphate transport protein (TIGR00153 family)
MVRLIPRETKFFDLFAEMATNLTEGARLLKAILVDMRDVGSRVEQLKTIEHRGDELTHELLTKLNQTFITPFDREDIHKLASSLDDVLDYIYAAGERLVMYKIVEPTPSAPQLADVVVRQGEQLCAAVRLLDGKHENVLQYCVEINRLENEADRIVRGALAQLFDTESNPIALIKKKELYEFLETASDKAEDAANVIESVVVKSA